MKVIDTLLFLMIVPEQVGRHRVAAHCFCHADPVTPVFFRDTCRVHFAAYGPERSADKKEITVAIRKSMPACLCQDAGKANRHQEYTDECCQYKYSVFFHRMSRIIFFETLKLPV